MRVTTNLFFDRAGQTIVSLGDRASELQTQISTGKRINTPSDDAASYRQLVQVRRDTTDTTMDQANIALAQSQLTASDTALASADTQLQRAREIAIQANTATTPPEQKKMLAAELDNILQDLVRIGNSTDSRGLPLFSGSTDAVPYTIDGDLLVTYHGQGEAGAIPIGNNAEIQASTSGSKIFNFTAAAGGTTDAFTVLKTLSDRLKSGQDAGNALTDLGTAIETVANARSSIGARGARLDLESSRLNDNSVTREELRSKIEDADISQTITELQKTLTVLQATQASFTKLSQLSLFDMIR